MGSIWSHDLQKRFKIADRIPKVGVGVQGKTGHGDPDISPDHGILGMLSFMTVDSCADPSELLWNDESEASD